MAQKEETEMSVKDMMPNELPGSDFHERRAWLSAENGSVRLADLAALVAERDNLAHDLAECERERERWRGLCSRLLDLAEEMKAAAAAACE